MNTPQKYLLPQVYWLEKMSALRLELKLELRLKGSAFWLRRSLWMLL